MSKRRIILGLVVCLSLTVLTAQILPQTRSSNRIIKPSDIERRRNVTEKEREKELEKTREQAKSEFDKKVADCFRVSWRSIKYNKTMSLYNPAVSSNGSDQKAVEIFTLSCEIEILDPNLTLGTNTEPIITQMVDSKGRDIDISQAQPRSKFMSYEGLRYHTRFRQPPRPPRWQTLIRSALRLPQKPRPRPKLVNELQPSPMRIDLDFGSFEPDSGEISRVKGYFHALMAESLEHVEVPFEPNDNWVRLTPDLEIQVREARCTESSYQFNTESSYQFNIETRSQGRPSMRPVSVEDYLPSRILVARQLIGEDGKPTRHLSGHRRVPASAGGRGSGSGNVGRIERIRYVIAVNPSHHKIPFTLEHIPLPEP